MAHSTTIPFRRKIRIIDGLKYVDFKHYESVLDMRDSLIDDQLKEIQALKQKLNKAEQVRE